MKALKKHGANATNETTLHLHCTYIFIFFLLLPSPPVCIEDHRQTQILSLINYTQILSLINYTRKHRIRKIAVLRGQDFLRVGWEESNLQWTSSQSRGGVGGGEPAMDKHSICALLLLC